MTAIRVLLAEDHALILSAIRSLLSQLEGVVVVAEAADGRKAVALAKAHQPDIAIMDISMQELNGIEATEQIREVSPGTRVLILSSHTSGDFVRRALAAGAAGYLSKDSAPQELKLAIDAVTRGETYVSSRVAHHVVASLKADGAGESTSSLGSLTSRQREILQLVAEGKSTKEIAFAMDISIKTVETHRAGIMERLGIRNVAGLTIFAVRSGLVSSGA